MRFKALLVVAAFATALIVPSQSSAKPKPVRTLTLTGTVVGAAFPSGPRTAVPVLLDARSVKRARLRGPLALVSLPGTADVRVPGSRTPALDLRPGDAFRLRARVRPAVRRAAYPSLKAGAGGFRVTRRGSTLSASELQRQLAGLSAYVMQLSAYVVAEFADLRGQLSTLRGQLGTLERAVVELRTRIDTMETSLQQQLVTLVAQVTTLQTQLQSITTQLGTLTGDVQGLQQRLAGIAPGDLADALSDIAALQALVGTVDVPALSSAVTTLSTKVGAVGGTDLQTQVTALSGSLTTAQTQLATAQAQVAHLCANATTIVTGNPLLSLTHLSACP